MERDDLMRILPPNIERVEPTGPFFIRKYPGSYTVTVLTEQLVTCGGPDSQEEALKIAARLNGAWREIFDKVKAEVTPDLPPEQLF